MSPGRVRRCFGPVEDLIWSMTSHLGMHEWAHGASMGLNKLWLSRMSAEHPGTHVRFDPVAGVGRETLMYCFVRREGLELGYYVRLPDLLITPDTVDAVAARTAARVLES